MFLCFTYLIHCLLPAVQRAIRTGHHSGLHTVASNRHVLGVRASGHVDRDAAVIIHRGLDGRVIRATRADSAGGTDGLHAGRL